MLVGEPTLRNRLREGTHGSQAQTGVTSFRKKEVKVTCHTSPFSQKLQSELDPPTPGGLGRARAPAGSRSLRELHEFPASPNAHPGCLSPLGTEATDPSPPRVWGVWERQQEKAGPLSLIFTVFQTYF